MKRNIGLILFNAILIISLMGLPVRTKASWVQDVINAPETNFALWFNGSIYPTSPTGWNWTVDAPFDATLRPDLPTDPVPYDGETGVFVDAGINNTVELSARVSDPDTPTNLTVSFYGRPYCSTPNFTLVALPDTQNYSSQTNNGTIAMFDAETQWIVDNKNARNIIYVTHVGDIVNDYTDLLQWDRANEALTRLETGSVAYGLSLGNHDGAPGNTTNYNTYFGVSRFTGRPYYGGHYSSDNDNSYGLFSSGGMNFIVINIEYGADAATRAWANDLLSVQYPTRRAIVVTHNLLIGTTSPAPFSPEGQALYDALKSNPNLFLMLGGHLDTEVSRTDMYNGHTVYSLRSDYQSDHGGNGWLRLMEFQPSANQIQVYTYSPYIDQWDTDANSQFPLPYVMGGTACDPWQLIVTKTGVASGSTPSANWESRDGETQYQWYVSISDGIYTVNGPIWSFTTGIPTAVSLVDFRAKSAPQGIQLDWETVQEIDLLGFNLFRAESPDGLQVQINPELIPAVNPGQLRSNDYQYVDVITKAGMTYYYWIEWIGNNSSEYFGPITASLAPYKVWLPLGMR